MAPTTPCYSCRARKPVRQYLCRDCWAQLPHPTRLALYRKDDLALSRLSELHQQIDGGRNLIDIKVTP